MKVLAAAASIGLSMLFVVVYSTTNWLASLATDVPSWSYEWEKLIPFVPLMVLPYMSIDLFFVAAPFLCADRAELVTLSRRIAFAILTAGFIFFVFPWKLVFERHPVEGWLGWIFNPFLASDMPYNLLPSLHISLRTILANLYARKTLGWLNLVTRGWFCLIGWSTLMLHQHHVVDVIGGFFLAGYAAYLFPSKREPGPATTNRRIARYYVVLPIVMFFLAAITPREGILLIWPAVAGLILVLAYVELGPGVYRKRDGVLPLSTKFALAPILVGQHLSLLYYGRQCRPWDEVAPGVWIGRRLNNREAEAAIQAGVTAVLDVTSEFSEAKPFLKLDYRNVQVLDLTAPTLRQLHQMAAFIVSRSKDGLVYVHCKAGYSRSAAAVAAYLLTSGQAETVTDAVEQLRAARHGIVIRPEILAALNAFDQDRKASRRPEADELLLASR